MRYDTIVGQNDKMQLNENRLQSHNLIEILSRLHVFESQVLDMNVKYYYDC